MRQILCRHSRFKGCDQQYFSKCSHKLIQKDRNRDGASSNGIEVTETDGAGFKEMGASS